MPATPDQLLDQGLALHRAGDLAAAARCYHAVLHRAPRHAEAWHLLGLVHAQTGDHANAVVLINRALAIAPRHAEAHYNLGNVHRQRGEPDQAIACYRCAIDADATMAKAWSNLGAVQSATGDCDGAIAACRQALAIDPGRIEAWYNLGGALHRADRADEAIAAYRETIHRQPRHADAHHNLALVLIESGQPAAALPVLQAAPRLDPGATVQIALSACLIALGAFDAALGAAQQAVRLAPQSAAALIQLGHAARELGRIDDALAAYARAHQADPASPDPLLALATLHQEAGDGAAALAEVDRALAIDPDHVGAWSLRVGLKRHAADDPALDRLEALVGQLSTRPDRRDQAISAEFALAKALMDIGAVDRAFARLASANAAQRARLAYDSAADCAQLAALERAFADRAEARSGPATGPIFIVGMPRSGTTLVEAMLGRHRAIHPGGELKHLDTVLMEHCGGAPDPAALAALDAETLARLAGQYRVRSRAGVGDGLRLTDKMPSNFRHCGLIARMFPDATIIHCRRDPHDTCLSIFATRFAQGQPFAYDLAELGAYYRAYRRLMAHWRTVLPATMLIEVDYEALVHDPQPQAQRLIAACGHDWDPACLTHHQAAGLVRTASVNQVRRPIYTSSVERARAYARHLVPLGL